MKTNDKYLKSVFPESWKTVKNFGSFKKILLALKKDMAVEKLTLDQGTVNPKEEFMKFIELNNASTSTDPTAISAPNNNMKVTITPGTSSDVTVEINVPVCAHK